MIYSKGSWKLWEDFRWGGGRVGRVERYDLYFQNITLTAIMNSRIARLEAG